MYLCPWPGLATRDFLLDSSFMTCNFQICDHNIVLKKWLTLRVPWLGNPHHVATIFNTLDPPLWDTVEEPQNEP